MRSTFPAIACAAAMTAILALPAEAQTRRRGTNPDQATRITTTDESGRTRTKITVRQRSFLDPGTATNEGFGAQHYTDYALAPGYPRYFYDRNDWKGSWSRNPLPGPFDVPGWW